MQPYRLYPPRKPNTVTVVMVEVDGGRAALARIIERIPSTKAIRVVSPSGIQRPLDMSEVVLEDLPADSWSQAVRIAEAKALFDAPDYDKARVAQARAEIMSAEYLLGFRVV